MITHDKNVQRVQYKIIDVIDCEKNSIDLFNNGYGILDTKVINEQQVLLIYIKNKYRSEKKEITNKDIYMTCITGILFFIWLIF